MKKILFPVLLLIAPSVVFALDLQGKPRNTDRSLFESISDYQAIEPGRFYFSNTMSISSNPMVDSKTKNVRVKELNDIDISMVTGVMKNWELGVSVPFRQTTIPQNSNINKYSGMSDIYFESKFNVLSNLAIVPMYVFQPSSGEATTGSAKGGYGVKIVGGFCETCTLPVYFSVGRLYLPNTTFYDLPTNTTYSQEERTQLSVGTLKNITKEIVFGTEFMWDKGKTNWDSKEVLAHLTSHFKSFSLRGGVGSGFLNSNKQNETRVILSLMFDVDFRKSAVAVSNTNKNKAESFEQIRQDELDEVQPKEDSALENKIKEIETLQKGDLENRQMNSVTESKTQTNEELKKQVSAEMKKFFKESSITKSEEKEIDSAKVLPFYSVKDLRSEVKKEAAVKPVDSILKEKQERLTHAEKNLQYFYELYKGNKLNTTKAQQELAWGLRVVNMRKATMTSLAEEHQLAEAKAKYSEETELEKKVKSALKDINKPEEPVIAAKPAPELMPSPVTPEPVQEVVQPASVVAPVVVEKKEEVVAEVKPEIKKQEKPKLKSLSDDELQKQQQRQWEVSKKKTYRELMAEKRNKKLKTQELSIKVGSTEKNLINDKGVSEPESNITIKAETIPAPIVEPVIQKETLIVKEETTTIVTPSVQPVQEVVPQIVKEEPATKIVETTITKQVETDNSSMTVDINTVEIKQVEVKTSPTTVTAEAPVINPVIVEKKETEVIETSNDKKLNATLDRINEKLDGVKTTTDYSKFYEKYKVQMDKLEKAIEENKEIEIVIKKDEVVVPEVKKVEEKVEAPIEEVKNVQINSIKERALIEQGQRNQDSTFGDESYESGGQRTYFGNGIEEEGSQEEMDEPLY